MAIRLRSSGRFLVLFAVLFLAGCQKVDVMTGMDEGDAVDLIVLLRQNGIAASKTPGGTGQDILWSVSVRPTDASDAFLVLAENDRPRTAPQGFGELFGKSKMIPTETEERALFLQAQSGELERTLEAMPSVIDARVHLSIPQRDRLREVALGEKTPVPTASVLVKHWFEDEELPPAARLDVAQIQSLVAGGIERLDRENVTVVLKPVAPTTGPAMDSGPDPMVLFYPLAGFTVLLVAMLIFLTLRNRSLSRQLDEAAAPRPAAAARS